MYTKRGAAAATNRVAASSNQFENKFYFESSKWWRTNVDRQNEIRTACKLYIHRTETIYNIQTSSAAAGRCTLFSFQCIFTLSKCINRRTNEHVLRRSSIFGSQHRANLGPTSYCAGLFTIPHVTVVPDRIFYL